LGLKEYEVRIPSRIRELGEKEIVTTGGTTAQYPWQKYFLSSIYEDNHTSRHDHIRIPEHVWLRAGVGDVMGLRLAAVHG
jgi:hypothetical protein